MRHPVNATRSVVLICCLALACCGRVATSTVIHRLGFSEISVVAVTVAAITDSGGVSTPTLIPAARLPDLWGAIAHDATAKTAVVFPRYLISMQTQRGDTLDIYIDETGEGYFTSSNWRGHQHFFHNKHLYEFVGQGFH